MTTPWHEVVPATRWQRHFDGAVLTMVYQPGSARPYRATVGCTVSQTAETVVLAMRRAEELARAMWWEVAA